MRYRAAIIRSGPLKLIITVAFCGLAAQSQPVDPAYAPLQKAYEALRARNYETAIANFEKAIAVAPKRAAIHKDLAYALLKIGENETARDQFREAMQLDPGDYHVALEYAFLCFETKQRAEARRVFDRVRKSGDPQSRATAETAFKNIDSALADGIARWSKAVELTPDNFSAHEELARLAEERDQLALAAQNYERAWRLRSSERSLLLDLGRVWKAQGRTEDSNAALLAASRGAQPRVAERAKELGPSRYPYLYEFQKALELDPSNLELRRELAYLLLAMDRKADAEAQFHVIVERTPDDLLSTAQLGFLLLARNDPDGAKPYLDRVLKGGDEELADRVRAALRLPRTLKKREETPRDRVSSEARQLAEKSLEKGYLKDALKYLTIAHESDPVDFNVMLKLGWTYNILKQDGEAVKWFNLARKSPDPLVAAEAEKAWKNLRQGMAPFRTTAWLFPFFSTRWHDLFTYGQVKTELRLAKLPFHPYISTRFIGDTRGTVNPRVVEAPQYLSESSFIIGAGVATTTWRGLTGWFEAGEQMRYREQKGVSGRMLPDYRGGLAFGRGLGHLLAPESQGWFAETSDDALFVSRFQNDFLLYSQNRTGYTLRGRVQLLWNWNVTTDVKRQYWANYVEYGPGLRFRWDALPPGILFSVSALRGNYFVQEGNPRGPVFHDLRVGFWYAFTH
jgi:Tfp pilus assembly protein PilF